MSATGSSRGSRKRVKRSKPTIDRASLRMLHACRSCSAMPRFYTTHFVCAGHAHASLPIQQVSNSTLAETYLRRDFGTRCAITRQVSISLFRPFRLTAVAFRGLFKPLGSASTRRTMPVFHRWPPPNRIGCKGMSASDRFLLTQFKIQRPLHHLHMRRSKTFAHLFNNSIKSPRPSASR